MKVKLALGEVMARFWDVLWADNKKSCGSNRWAIVAHTGSTQALPNPLLYLWYKGHYSQDRWLPEREKEYYAPSFMLELPFSPLEVNSPLQIFSFI